MNSEVSCVLGRGNTCSSLSQWCGHTQQAPKPVCVALAGCCPLHAGPVQALTNLSGQSCCSAQPQSGKQEEPELPVGNLWLIQGVPSAVRNQAHEGHSGSPVLFPSPIYLPYKVCFMFQLLRKPSIGGPQTSQKSQGWWANVLAPSSTALVSASTMQIHGISILPAPLLSGLPGSLPFILLGKMGEAKSWQHPTRKTPEFMEAVLKKFYRSMEAEVAPSTSMLADPFFPLLYPWKHLPQSTLPSRAWSSHYYVVALPNQPQVSSEASVPQRILVFNPTKSFKFFCT